MNTILFATNNQNKVNELNVLLKEYNIKIKTLNDFNLKNPIENGLTFKENSIIKAKYGFEKTNIPTIADDSGFSIDYLNGFPGVVSKRFQKAFENNEKLFQIINYMLQDFNKSCSFITSLTFIHKDKNNNIITKSFEGKIKGQFTYPPKGLNGFGYDPIFTPNKYIETFAEMTTEEKSKISHRGIALQKFLKYFKSITK